MRPWLLLGLALSAGALGLGFMSVELVRLDRRALVSEQSRLALWRMDLALARLLAAESTRPASDYQPGSLALGGGAPQHVWVHFDVSPSGVRTTPELGLEARLAQLPASLVPPLPSATSLAVGNDPEFNRRANLALNNALPRAAATESPMSAAWFGDALMLVRRVRLADGLHVQGASLDWSSLAPSLLREVKDLLPEARLVPVKGSQPGDRLMLASLPARLVPGEPTERTSSTRWVVTAAWLSYVVLAVALSLLLLGALALDQRRAAFVSAVTHELRTPLTTFKLYAEMLEEGMVPAQKQKEYLATLRQEANRLGYLVENVLAYAQIEKGRKTKPLVAMRCTDLLAPILPRLQARAQSTLLVGDLPEAVVKADPVSVEQILFNLVDNACKYARAPALSVETSARELVIAVTDDGPGVSAEVEKKLFEPLRKSAAEAADGAQGIGLGLALSRRLARAMGGELRYVKRQGARFELVLPVTRA